MVRLKEWKELTEGMFTYDATARAGVRQDYAGGVEDNMFFLRNGGFFNDNTEFKSVLHVSRTELLRMST